jgi:hypothetical protein
MSSWRREIRFNWSLRLQLMRRVLASSCEEALREVSRHDLSRPWVAEKGVASWPGFPVVLMLSLRLRMGF